MKKNRFLFGMPAVLLAFGLVLVGCDNPVVPGPDPGKDTVVNALILDSMVTAPVMKKWTMWEKRKYS